MFLGSPPTTGLYSVFGDRSLLVVQKVLLQPYLGWKFLSKRKFSSVRENQGVLALVYSLPLLLLFSTEKALLTNCIFRELRFIFQTELFSLTTGSLPWLIPSNEKFCLLYQMTKRDMYSFKNATKMYKVIKSPLSLILHLSEITSV